MKLLTKDEWAAWRCITEPMPRVSRMSWFRSTTRLERIRERKARRMRTRRWP